MIDITTSEKDKRDFITKIELSDDIKTFKVVYADEHEEIHDFYSVHNFNVYVHKMKEQYERFGKAFEDKMKKWVKESIVKSLINLLLTLEAVLITGKYFSDDLVKIALLVIISIYSVGYMMRRFRDVFVASCSLDYADRIDRFITIQEKLKVPVIDPNTGKEEDWYMANLSDVDFATDVSLYEKLALSLEDKELREEEGMKLSKTLKGE